jgi:hypothetical protein
MCLTLLPAQSNKKLKPKIENPTLSSSNLELAIDKALTLSESLEKIWVDGDLKNDKNCNI